jgi:protein LSM14
MLQRFNKEKMMQTAEAKKTINAVQSQPVYNKDDFFDTMSSEATEKQESGNRNRFHEQRRTDAMTFGFDAVTQSHAAQRAATAGRGDGGRGGRGGREGGRGGRGGRDSGRGRGGRR